jgi:crossover junction endodeoxyribonuclease RusA
VSDCITIELSLPPKEVSPNSRSHWAVKSRARKLQREEAYLCAKAACANPPRWTLAEVESTFYVATMGDRDNRIGSLKATLDGLADAGIVDNDRAFIPLPPKQVIDGKRTGKRGVVLRITKREQ